MGSINVIVAVLAVRLILLLPVLGAIALTGFALASPDPMRLGGVALFTLTVLLPMVWLSSRK